MPDKRSLVYWDANCFLRLINKREDSWSILQSIVERSEDAEDSLRIVTSTLSITEVAYGADEQLREERKKGRAVNQMLSDDDLLKIEAFWAIGGPADLAEYTATTGRQARAVIRRTRGRVKGFDAVHVATAIALNVDEMNTYDRDILGADLKESFPIRHAQADLQGSLPGIEPDQTI